MTEKELIPFCRYYKGEKESPYKNALLSTIWMFEHNWVTDAIESSKKDIIAGDMGHNLNAYLDAGLREFEQFDDTPATLKSYLYALHLKDNEMPMIEDFKAFYKKWRDRKIP